MESGNEGLTLRQKVEKSTNMQKKVLISFPLALFRKFDDYCKTHSADCYWLSIEQLLDYRNENLKKDQKTQMLIDRDDANFKILDSKLKELDKRVEDIELKSTQPKRKAPNHFGGNEDES